MNVISAKTKDENILSDTYSHDYRMLECTQKDMDYQKYGCHKKKKK